jgi:hypothetical protein
MCHALRQPTVLAMSRSPNKNACQGFWGEICGGEHFIPGGPCRVVGGRKWNGAIPPGTSSVSSEWRAGILAACSWSREADCSQRCGPLERAARSFPRASTAMSRLVER